MKINKDLIISDTSKNLGTLNSEVETLKLKTNETVLWTGQIKINTSNNGTLTLSGMPNLSNYSGKLLRLYVGYISDMTSVLTFHLNNVGNPIFFELIRDFDGNSDVWHLCINFTNVNSTSWKAKTNLSYQIKNSTINAFDGKNYNWYLRKVAVLDV